MRFIEALQAERRALSGGRDFKVLEFEDAEEATFGNAHKMVRVSEKNG